MNLIQIQNQINDLILSEIKNGDIDLADELLSISGHNLNEINTYADKIHKQQSFLIKGLINKQNDEKLLQKAALLIDDAIKNKIQKPITYLNTLVNQNKFAVQYRNLDKLNTEEIIEIIKDQNLLEILENLENSN